MFDACALVGVPPCVPGTEPDHQVQDEADDRDGGGMDASGIEAGREDASREDASGEDASGPAGRR